MYCDLKVARHRASRSGLFWDEFVLRMCRNSYVRAFGQNSDIAIRFSDCDFLKDSNNSAIRRRFGYFFTVQIQNLPYFYFRSFNLTTLNTYFMLRSVVG